jgi:hypothetical protein
MDLGALPLPFSDSFIPVLVSCADNSGRRCIFPRTLKIRLKNSFLPISVPDEILMD